MRNIILFFISITTLSLHSDIRSSASNNFLLLNPSDKQLDKQYEHTTKILPETWDEEPFIYPVYYIKKVIYDTEVLEPIWNKGIFAKNVETNDIVFIGKTSGISVRGLLNTITDEWNFSQFISAAQTIVDFQIENRVPPYEMANYEPFHIDGICQFRDGSKGKWSYTLWYSAGGADQVALIISQNGEPKNIFNALFNN